MRSRELYLTNEGYAAIGCTEATASLRARWQDNDAEGGEARVEVLGEAEYNEEAEVAERTTTKYMTKYERARILGTRALQIRCPFHSTHDRR
jgi:hypothetical protein